MPLFRKRPVEVEAIRVVDLCVEDGSSQWRQLPDWVRTATTEGTLRIDRTAQTVAIETAEGTMTGQSADWVLRGVRGELYPCKPDIFAETYTPVLPETARHALPTPPAPTVSHRRAAHDFVERWVRRQAPRMRNSGYLPVLEDHIAALLAREAWETARAVELRDGLRHMPEL